MTEMNPQVFSENMPSFNRYHFSSGHMESAVPSKYTDTIFPYLQSYSVQSVVIETKIRFSIEVKSSMTQIPGRNLANMLLDQFSADGNSVSETKRDYSSPEKCRTVLGDSAENLEKIDNEDLKNNVEKFLCTFSEASKSFTHLSEVPVLRLEEVEDDDAFFEYRYRNIRIGFTIVADIQASSWFMFLTHKKVTLRLSGELAEGMPRIIRNILKLASDSTNDKRPVAV